MPRGSGAGIGLRAQVSTPEKVRAAVRRLLDEPAFRARAGVLGAEPAAGGGPARSAGLVQEPYEATATARPAEAPAGASS
jgi:UDP:flavonoid glycosyltransferase YjiC (YdhE family)